MNPLAEELNEVITNTSEPVFSMLSELGRELFYPKGILSQSAEAKAKGKKFNATIGIATENGEGMHLPCARKYINDLTADEIFTYAPSFGVTDLRETWRKKIETDTPSLDGRCISLPVVTHALTHGLSIAADLFMDPGDIVVLPDKIWGNYKLLFQTRKKAEFVQFPFFSGQGLNCAGLEQTLDETAKTRDKIILLLNFPNNPTGYSLSKDEGNNVCELVKKTAETGTKVIVFIDDAYYGLFYEEETLKESLFGRLAGLHENVMAVKIDGATKEYFLWGFRVGFVTYGVKNGTPEMYEALTRKTAGAVRGNISNCSMLSQNLVLRILNDPALPDEKQAKFETMKERAVKVREVLEAGSFEDAWEPYPFNSGYFMCLRLKNAAPEKVRLHLLDKYETGVIAVNDTDIRVAFSCLEVDQIEELFQTLYKAVKEIT